MSRTRIEKVCNLPSLKKLENSLKHIDKNPVQTMLKQMKTKKKRLGRPKKCPVNCSCDYCIKKLKKKKTVKKRIAGPHDYDKTCDCDDCDDIRCYNSVFNTPKKVKKGAPTKVFDAKNVLYEFITSVSNAGVDLDDHLDKNVVLWYENSKEQRRAEYEKEKNKVRRKVDYLFKKHLTKKERAVISKVHSNDY